MSFSHNLIKKGIVVMICTAILGNNAVYAEGSVTPTEDNSLLVSSLFDEDVEIKNIKVRRSDKDEILRSKHMGTFSGAKKIGVENGIAISNTRIGYAADVFSPMETSDSTESEGELIGNKALSSEEFYSEICNFKSDGEGDDFANDTGRDEDIENINNGLRSAHAASVEFDVIPKTDKIYFEYIFASRGILGYGKENLPNREERKAYLGAMGIWINGQNKSFIPGTNLPVNSINIDDTEKFVKIDDSFEPHYPFSTPKFTCESEVKPNKLNHVKIALACSEGVDITDSAILIKGKFLDSGRKHEEINVEETKEKEELDYSEEQEKIIENPKTSDINLFIITASTLASAMGLSILAKKHNKR